MVLVVFVIFLVPIAIAGAVLAPDGQKQRSTGSWLDCIPYERPTSVSDVNDFVVGARETPGFVGGDVGASTALSDGRNLWVFGDTLRPPDEPGPSMVRNSMLLTGDGCASVYRPADNGAAIPDREDGVGYWPMSVTSVPGEEGTDRVAVGLMRVRTIGSGMWDFEIVGSSVARFEVTANAVPRLVGVVDLDPDDARMSEPLWGAATAVDGEQVYVYGTANPGEPYVYGYSLHVARTTVEKYLDVNSWEYWDGSTWTREADSAVSLVPAVEGVSRALSVFEQNGSWYAVSKRLDFLGNDLVIWKASSPQGPFVPSPPVAQIPTDDKFLQYMPLAHPELLPEDGSVVVSWSVNAMDPTTLDSDPSLYRPRFLRVPLP